MPARTRAVAAGAVLLAMTISQPPAAAQSLEQQYASLLSGKCAGMGFARDGQRNLLPGQAGPHLQEFCSGMITAGDGVGTISSSATAGFSAGALSDEAAARRQGAAHDGPQSATEQVLEAELADSRDGFHASLRYVGETREPGRFEGGRRAHLIGLVVGVDRRVSATGLVGIAVQLEDQHGSLDSGGDFGHQGHGLLLYGSWLPLPEVFIDAVAGLAFRDTRVHRTVSFERTFTPAGAQEPTTVLESIAAAPVRSQSDHTELHAGLQAGHDLRRGRSTFGPRLALQYRQTDIGAARESGSTAMALVIAPQAATSLRTGLGLQASHVLNTDSAVLVAQFGAEWWHEFRDDQRFITARFAEDLRPEPSILRFQTEPPDRDTFVAQASLSATLRGGWSGFAAVDAVLGHTHRRLWGVSLGLRKEL